MCFWLSAALDDPSATLVTEVAWWTVVLNLLGMREQSATPAMAACISIHACRVPESPQALVKCNSDTRLIKSEHGGTLQAGKCFGTPGGPPDAGPIKQASRGGSGRFCTRLACKRTKHCMWPQGQGWRWPRPRETSRRRSGRFCPGLARIPRAHQHPLRNDGAGEDARDSATDLARGERITLATS